MEIFGKSNLTFIKKYDIILKKDIITLGQRGIDNRIFLENGRYLYKPMAASCTTGAGP